MVDASLLQFYTVWLNLMSPDSPAFRTFLHQHPAMSEAISEYRMRNRAVLDFAHDLITYQSDTVTGRDIEKFQDANDGLGLCRHLAQISSPLRAGRQDVLRIEWSKAKWSLEGSPIEISDAVLRMADRWEMIAGNSIVQDPSAFYREWLARTGSWRTRRSLVRP